MSILMAKIAAEIGFEGAIPFDRFMELALYCPVYGYYEKEEDKVGRTGDFYTSVSVGPLFGRLLAARFSRWLDVIASTLNRTDSLFLVEAGAHSGQSAHDIASWLQTWRPELLQRLTYIIVEPSSTREQRQRQLLACFGSNMKWVRQVDELPDINGIVFSNELLDAMPVRRFKWSSVDQTWRELGVTMGNGALEWQMLHRAVELPALLTNLSPALLEALPDGFIFESGQAAVSWWRDMARKVRRGYLVTFDYGLHREEFFLPERMQGTLRSYSHHKVSSDVLQNPGDRDITAHVDFTSLIEAGEAAGLKTTTFERQSAFLTRIGADIWEGPIEFEKWSEHHTRQFQTLTHPEHLGRAFKVLVQATADLSSS